ncbi:MAG: bacteriohemerythrin [Gammaproteobacteria bacterium]|nr:bacteriohemerythrin [Gammaproteobacteria bacterium]
MHMIWSDDLNTGIAEIDAENQKIVHYLNALSDARESGDSAVLGTTLDNLLDYAVNHFLFEEHLMAEANYKYRASHEAIHEMFAKKLADLRGRHSAGEDVHQALISMLRDWVNIHIRQEDQKYADAVGQTIEKEGGQSWISGVVKKLFG